MPQLDHLSYLSQVFWLIVIFGSFYFITLTYILPTISQIIKTRKEKLSSYTTDSSSLKIEEKLLTYKYQEYLSKAFTNSGKALSNALEVSSTWSKEQLKNYNLKSKLGKLNAKIVTKIATLSYRIKNADSLKVSSKIAPVKKKTVSKTKTIAKAVTKVTSVKTKKSKKKNTKK